MELAAAVDHFLHGYFSTCQRSPKTQAAYQIDLAQLQEHLGRRELLAAISDEYLENWASELIRRKYAPASIRRKFATLRTFFGYWVRKRVLSQSPLWRIRLELERENRLPRSLTAGDAQRLLDRAWAKAGDLDFTAATSKSDRYRRVRNLAVMELLFATGIRVGELVALSMSDWCHEDKSFLIKGKGSRQRLAILPDDRSVALTEKYLNHRTSLGLNHDALFVNSAGV